jgi:uncharacterized damage-inducible protein DinB
LLSIYCIMRSVILIILEVVMRENFLFDSMENLSQRIVTLAETCPVEKRNTVPEGFNNSIYWHLGHVLNANDGILYGFTGQQSKVPAHFRDFFRSGTKPADWTSEPPAWETLVAQWQEQSQQIRADFAGKLDQPVKENFAKAETLEELLTFLLVHDAGHYGNMQAMLKLLV